MRSFDIIRRTFYLNSGKFELG